MACFFHLGARLCAIQRTTGGFIPKSFFLSEPMDMDRNRTDEYVLSDTPKHAGGANDTNAGPVETSQEDEIGRVGKEEETSILASKILNYSIIPGFGVNCFHDC